jgi:DNA-binding NtrC family response regulator
LARLPHLRKDLFYAFTALPVAMPALANRRHDIVRLAEAILRRLAPAYGQTVPVLDEEAAAWLATLPLPANVIELEALMRGAILTPRQNRVTASTLEIVGRGLGMSPHSSGQQEALTIALEQSIEQGGFAIDDLNRQIYQMTIRRAGGNVAQAARMLGLSRAQFAYRLGQISNARIS